MSSVDALAFTEQKIQGFKWKSGKATRVKRIEAN